jgi:hypothetical protein
MEGPEAVVVVVISVVLLIVESFMEEPGPEAVLVVGAVTSTDFPVITVVASFALSLWLLPLLIPICLLVEESETGTAMATGSSRVLVVATVASFTKELVTAAASGFSFYLATTVVSCFRSTP